MKKNILLALIVLSFSSFLFSGTIQPSLSMRFNDIVNTDSESGTIDPSLVLGFAMTLEDGVYAGFDSDGTDGKMYYNTVADDLDEAGSYKLQGKVAITDGTFYTDITTFKVHRNL